MTNSLVREFIKNGEANQDDRLEILSKRELEILPLVAKGYGNKEIAEMLYISVKTVEAHKAKIMEKLNLKSKPELVEYALKKEIVRILRESPHLSGELPNLFDSRKNIQWNWESKKPFQNISKGE